MAEHQEPQITGLEVNNPFVSRTEFALSPLLMRWLESWVRYRTILAHPDEYERTELAPWRQSMTGHFLVSQVRFLLNTLDALDQVHPLPPEIRDFIHELHPWIYIISVQGTGRQQITVPLPVSEGEAAILSHFSLQTGEMDLDSLLLAFQEVENNPDLERDDVIPVVGRILTGITRRARTLGIAIADPEIIFDERGTTYRFPQLRSAELADRFRAFVDKSRFVEGEVERVGELEVRLPRETFIRIVDVINSSLIQNEGYVTWFDLRIAFPDIPAHQIRHWLVRINQELESEGLQIRSIRRWGFVLTTAEEPELDSLERLQELTRKEVLAVYTHSPHMPMLDRLFLPGRTISVLDLPEGTLPHKGVEPMRGVVLETLGTRRVMLLTDREVNVIWHLLGGEEGSEAQLPDADTTRVDNIIRDGLVDGELTLTWYYIRSRLEGTEIYDQQVRDRITVLNRAFENVRFVNAFGAGYLLTFSGDEPEQGNEEERVIRQTGNQILRDFDERRGNIQAAGSEITLGKYTFTPLTGRPISQFPTRGDQNLRPLLLEYDDTRIIVLMTRRERTLLLTIIGNGGYMDKNSWERLRRRSWMRGYSTEAIQGVNRALRLAGAFDTDAIVTHKIGHTFLGNEDSRLHAIERWIKSSNIHPAPTAKIGNTQMGLIYVEALFPEENRPFTLRKIGRHPAFNVLIVQDRHMRKRVLEIPAAVSEIIDEFLQTGSSQVNIKELYPNNSKRNNRLKAWSEFLLLLEDQGTRIQEGTGELSDNRTWISWPEVTVIPRRYM